MNAPAIHCICYSFLKLLLENSVKSNLWRTICAEALLSATLKRPMKPFRRDSCALLCFGIWSDGLEHYNIHTLCKNPAVTVKILLKQFSYRSHGADRRIQKSTLPSFVLLILGLPPTCKLKCPFYHTNNTLTSGRKSE